MEVTELKVNSGFDSVIEPGKSFEVSLTLKGRDIKNPRMFLIIENILGQSLVHSHVFSKEIGLEKIDGSYILKLSIPALWLSPGLYSMYFKVIANSVEWEGRVNSERLMIEVRGAMENTGRAVLHPDVKWQFESLRV